MEKQLDVNKWEAKNWVAELGFIFLNIFSEKYLLSLALNKTTSNTVYISWFRFRFIVMVDSW